MAHQRHLDRDWSESFPSIAYGTFLWALVPRSYLNLMQMDQSSRDRPALRLQAELARSNHQLSVFGTRIATLEPIARELAPASLKVSSAMLNEV